MSHSVPVRARAQSRVPSRTSPGVRVRFAAPDDSPHTAAIHVAELSRGLFPRLGVPFIARWHDTYVGVAHGIALTATRRDDAGVHRVVGFLIGASDQDRHVSETILRRGLGLAASGLLALLLRPGLLLLFLRTRVGRYARRFATAVRSSLRRDGGTFARSGSGTRIGVVTAIAVAPSGRRSGVGRALLDAFLAECAARGVLHAELVAAADARGVNDFYVMCGWRLLDAHRTVDGTTVNRYSIDLDPSPGPVPVEIVAPRDEPAP